MLPAIFECEVPHSFEKQGKSSSDDFGRGEEED
jgi:hypothetical protein